MSNKIKYLLLISAFTFLISTSLALAQEDQATSLPPEPNPQNVSIDGVDPVPTLYDAKRENGQAIKQFRGDMQNARQDIKVEMEKKKVEMKDLRDQAKQKMEDLKTKIKDLKDKTKAKIQETRIMGREKALENFDNAIGRVEDLKTKVTDQVTKMEAQTMVIPSTIKDLSNQAETKLTLAKGKIVEINALLATSTNALTTADKTKLNTLTQDTQTLIKEAHQLLNDEVVGLKQVIQAKIQALKDLNIKQ